VSERFTSDIQARYPEGARVVITTISGAKLEHLCGEAYGAPGRPLTDDDLWRKFTACAEFAGVTRAALDGAYPLITESASAAVKVATIAEALIAADQTG
jgi:hypothetical protein